MMVFFIDLKRFDSSICVENQIGVLYFVDNIIGSEVSRESCRVNDIREISQAKSQMCQLWDGLVSPLESAVEIF